MTDLFIFSATLAFLIYLWRDTNVFAEWLKFTRVWNFCYLKDYWLLKEPAVPGTVPYVGNYTDFLIEYHLCFWVKLLTCPFCLSFWLSLALAICAGDDFTTLDPYFGVLSVGYLCAFLYGALSKVLA